MCGRTPYIVAAYVTSFDLKKQYFLVFRGVSFIRGGTWRVFLHVVTSMTSLAPLYFLLGFFFFSSSLGLFHFFFLQGLICSHLSIIVPWILISQNMKNPNNTVQNRFQLNDIIFLYPENLIASLSKQTIDTNLG